MYAPHPVTALVEDIFTTTRELDEAPLTPRQREKIANLRHHATELERRRAYAEAFLRVGETNYTERLARELGFKRKAIS